MKAPVYIVDLIGEIVSATDAVLYSALGKHLVYTYGRVAQIEKKLIDLTNGKYQKYPLIALYMPFPENRGVQSGYYADVVFPKLVIATLTKGTDEVSDRMENTFKTELYPIYYELLKQIAQSKYTVVQDPNRIVHTKIDQPGKDGDKTGINDIVDMIFIQNMQLTFKQFCS